MKNFTSAFKYLIGLLLISVTAYGATIIQDGLITDLLDVDNVRIDGNTVSTTNTNGDLTFDLNGTGSLIFTDLTATTVPYLDASKKLVSSSATPTQLGYLGVVTSDLCGISQSCTLTNKTLTGNTAVNLVSGSGTFIFNTSGTMTVPNGTDTLGAVGLAQTFTNKTLTSPAINGANLVFGTATNTNRILLPTETSTNLNSLSNTAGLLAYDTTKTKPVYNDGVAWRDIGSGSGGGGAKNYLGTVNGLNANGDFELGTTAGWALGTTGTITNGFPTGTPNFSGSTALGLSIGTATFQPLSGVYSLNYNSSVSGTTVGNMFASSAFTIDRADAAKVMTVRFSYEVRTGAAQANFSGTSLNSYAWAVWDATNSTWIPPTGAFCMTQSSGVANCTGTFQTSATGTQYRFVVYNANATSGTGNTYFDDFFLGPETAPVGAVQTDWVAYTPTLSGFGTVTGVSVFSRRNGPNLEVQGSFTPGTVAASTASLTLGFNGSNGNVTVDSRITSLRVVGTAIVNAAGNTVDFAGRTVLANGGATSVNFGAHANTINPSAAANGNVVTGNTTSVNFFFSVPIQGWSSNVQMSSDTDTRVVSMTGTQVSQAVTGNVTNIAFTATKDSHGAWNGTQFVVPVSGDYVAAGSLVTNTTSVTGLPYVNGAPHPSLWATSGGSGTVTSGSALLSNLKAGDLVSLRLNAGATVSSGAISIFRLSGPSVVAATESVNASYTNTAGTAIGTGNTDVPFATKVFDSHNAFASPTYTVPVSGKYRVTVNFFTVGVTITTAQSVNVQVVQAGSASVTNRVGRANGTGAANAYSINGTTVLNCLAGDTIKVQASSGVATSMETTAGTNLIYIERIGN